MKKHTIHFLQHTPVEGLGSIENWIHAGGHNLTSTQLYNNPVFPDVNQIDWLIIMGGPMSVYEETIYPWLKEEKKFIKICIEKNKVVLGICLGAQLIADVLSANVYPNMYKEIGWFPIRMTADAKQNLIFNMFPNEMYVFQWHGDTFDIPQDATHIAVSEACKNQAFVFNDKVVALQFHFEVNENDIDDMVTNFSNELKKSNYVQTVEEIARGKNYIPTNTKFINMILDRLNMF